MIEIIIHYPKIYIKETNHDSDHIHILISVPPQIPVGRVVDLLKANTSRGIKEKFTVLKKHYWGSGGIWSDGYFVSTVGITTEIIRRYIKNQGELDVGQTIKLFD